MPAKINEVPAKTTAEPALKFEVSAEKLFHFKVAGASSQISVDVGAGDYGRKVTVPIPEVVQNASSTVYGYVAPYAELAYNKLLKKKSIE